MVRVVSSESGLKIMAETPDGQEVDLATKPPHGREDLSIMQIYDIAVRESDTKKTIVEYYHMGLSPFSSWRYNRCYRDKVSDIKKAFDEAGLKMPEVITPRHIKLARVAVRALGLEKK
jgi:hypothetical protein